MTCRNGRRFDDDTSTNKFDAGPFDVQHFSAPEPTSWGRILAICLAFVVVIGIAAYAE